MYSTLYRFGVSFFLGRFFDDDLGVAEGSPEGEGLLSQGEVGGGL